MKAVVKTVFSPAMIICGSLFFGCDDGASLKPAEVPTPDNPIIMVSPAGGERYFIGDTLHIQWESDSSLGTVSIQISLDGGKIFYPLSTSKRADSVKWENYPWVIPESLDVIVDKQWAKVPPVSDSCIIMLQNYPRPEQLDMNESFFSIKK